MKKTYMIILFLIIITACTKSFEVKNMPELKITSIFENNQNIPVKYTCDGQDINPLLYIKGLPNETKSLVLIMDDPDAPIGVWDHWVIWNIPFINIIEENTVPGEEGLNSWNRKKYGGPCPPSGTHRYFFKVYALDTMLSISSSSRKKDVEKAMKGHVLAKGQLMGLYSRK